MLVFDYSKYLNLMNNNQNPAETTTQQASFNAETSSTNPILGQQVETKAQLENGNVPMTANADASKTQAGLGVEGADKKYIKVDVNKLPKKNTFYNTLEQYHPGFKKLSADKKKEVFVDYLRQIDPSQRNEVIQKMHQKGYYAEVDDFMISCNKELGDLAVNTNHIALTNSQNAAIKKYQDKLVAKNYTKAQAEYQNTILKDIYKYAGKDGKMIAAEETANVDKKYQIEAAKITANQGDKDVAATGAGVTWKFAKENQVEAVKIYRKLNLEKVDMSIAKVEGKYDKENQQAIYKSLMQSKYKSVLKTAANGIYTLDKDNQAAAVKMTSETGDKDAIEATRVHYNDYDESSKQEISETLNNTTSSSSANNSTAVDETATTSEKLETLISSNDPDKDVKCLELLKTANSVDQLKVLKSLTPAEAVLLGMQLDNPTIEIQDYLAQIADKLSPSEKNRLASTLSHQVSNATLARFANASNDDLAIAFIDSNKFS
jgi:hypothetical protein